MSAAISGLQRGAITVAILDIIHKRADYKAGETRRFEMKTKVPPASAAFDVYDKSGAVVVAPPNGNDIVYSDPCDMYVNRVVPDKPGIYKWQWTLWDVNSKAYYISNDFEIVP